MAESLPESTPNTASRETSLSLLERVRANHPESWDRFVRLYSPLVFSWGRKLGLGPEDSADLVQSVWGAVAEHIGRFERKGGTFRGWLWTIARNKANDHFRKRAGSPQAAGGTEAQQVLQRVPEHEPADETGAEEHGLLHRALELIRPEFEERTWQAFWRLTVDGRSAADVGAELAMLPNAVHQAKFRVLRRLREEMADLMDAPTP